jgi:hypothetical protein
MALISPAMIDDTCVSPKAKSENGTLLSRTATTAKWRHVDRRRGRGVLVTTHVIERASAPRAILPKATSIGEKYSRPSLIHQNEQPHVVASKTKETCHGSQ